MRILKKLYDGKIDPAKYIIPEDPDYRSLTSEIGNGREYFESKLLDEDKEKFEKWNEQLQEYDEIVEYANFAYGFKLGAKFALDMLS